MAEARDIGDGSPSGLGTSQLTAKGAAVSNQHRRPASASWLSQRPLCPQPSPPITRLPIRQRPRGKSGFESHGAGAVARYPTRTPPPSVWLRRHTGGSSRWAIGLPGQPRGGTRLRGVVAWRIPPAGALSCACPTTMRRSCHLFRLWYVPIRSYLCHHIHAAEDSSTWLQPPGVLRSYFSYCCSGVARVVFERHYWHHFRSTQTSRN